jgi:uncharacterized protein (TIGR00725 family)
MKEPMIRIGVMGSASGHFSPELVDSCHRLGAAIAKRGCCLLTGACPGLPHEVVLGAYALHGHIVGISPASSAKEHVGLFKSPFEEYDVMIYTGLGTMGRELINIRSSDIIVIVGGSSGTLGEFSIAYEEGKLIGVLEHSGGVANLLREIVSNLGKATGAEILYNSDPLQLIDQLLARYEEKVREK